MANPITITDVDSSTTFSVTTSTTGPFAFTFEWYTASDIEVYVDDVLLANTAYTVSTTGGTVFDDGTRGGDVTLDTAVANATVTVRLAMPITKLVNFSPGQLDIALMNTITSRFFSVLRSLTEKLSRTLVMPPSYSGSTIPSPGALEFIRWNSAGTALETAAADLLPTSVNADSVLFDSVGTGAVQVTAETMFLTVVTPYNFGGTGTPLVNDAAAVQAAIDYVKGTYDSDVGEFTVKLDFAGQNWRVESPIDATLIRQPGFTMQNGGLYGAMTGGIVLDLSGTNSMVLQAFRVYGDKTDVPDVGILQARALISGSYSAAGSHKWFDVQVNGYFNKSAVINFASEVSSYYGCRFTNKSRSLTAYAFASVSNAAVLTDFVGGLTSSFQTIQTADSNQSNICHYHAKAHIQRPADVNLVINSVTPGTNTIVDVGSTELTAAGLSNTDPVWVYSLAGSGSEWESLNYNVYTVGNLDEGAGTFELTGANSTGFTDTFTSGRVQNQTGPAMLFGGSTATKICDSSYFTVYGSPVFRVSTDYDASFNENEISGQMEHSPPTVMEFDRSLGTAFTVQKLALELLNAAQVNTDDVISYAGGGSGQINLNSLVLDITTMGTAPTNGIFSDATLFRLHDARIHTPLAASMNTISDFVNFTGEVYSVDDNTRTIYDVGTITVSKTTLDEPFFNLTATADGDTTSAISTLQTPSGTKRHIQVDINGVKYWITAYPTLA